MQTIKVLCLSCNKSFDFNHPSVNSAADLGKVTIDCQNCGEVLRRADHHIVMESLHTQMRRNLEPVIGKEAAAAAKFEAIDIGENPIITDQEKMEALKQKLLTEKANQDLPNSPLAHHDELAALRDKLMRGEGK